MNRNNIELTVLIKDRPIPEYHHEDQVFIEGRSGSEYEIELRNRTNARVEIVLSIDGLSVIDGQAAGAQSRGYLVDAYGSMRVPGWLLDNQSVAKFAFAGKRQSYAAQMTGDSRNDGVIGVMAFAEKIHYPQYPQYHYISHPNLALGPIYHGVNINTSAAINTFDSTQFYHTGTNTPINSASWVGSASTINTCDPQNISMNATCFDASVLNEGRIVEQSLGTAFGEAADFATRTVAFERAHMIVMMTIMYDNIRGLKARGIEIVRPRKQRQHIPEAFPAMHCNPPPGWTSSSKS